MKKSPRFRPAFDSLAARIVPSEISSYIIIATDPTDPYVQSGPYLPVTNPDGDPTVVDYYDGSNYSEIEAEYLRTHGEEQTNGEQLDSCSYQEAL